MAILSLNSQEIENFLKSFGAELDKSIDTRKAALESAALVASLIKKRTLAGRDVDNKPFAPYKSGSSKVNLSLSGKMLDAIEVKMVSDAEAMVGIFDPEQQKKAIIHQLGLGNAPRRRFFGISENDTAIMNQIIAIFTKEINKAVKKV